MIITPKAIMQVITQAFILFIAIGEAWLSPLEIRNQGDMLLSEERNVFADKYLWPGGVIPYKISNGLANVTKRIEDAIQHIMNGTCIQFVPWDDKTKDYVNISNIPEKGCLSNIGWVSGRKHLVSLPYGCQDFGTIVHELMHTLGFDHEHNRPDRNKYLIFYPKNIWPAAYSEFAIKSNRLIKEFDYDSILLYGEYYFSKDGKSTTMKSSGENKLVPVHEKNGLSELDVEKINILYKCEENN